MCLLRVWEEQMDDELTRNKKWILLLSQWKFPQDEINNIIKKRMNELCSFLSLMGNFLFNSLCCLGREWNSHTCCVWRTDQYCWSMWLDELTSQVIILILYGVLHDPDVVFSVIRYLVCRRNKQLQRWNCYVSWDISKRQKTAKLWWFCYKYC